MVRTPYVGIHIPSATGRRVGARDIVDAFVAEVSSGRLPAGCRVPPVRVLEKRLAISKNTVQAAYDELVARGLLETRAREGVFVAAPVERDAPTAAAAVPPAPPLREVPALFRTRPRVDRINLSSVFIDPDLLPWPQIEECVRAALPAARANAFYDLQGHPALREAIAARLRRLGMPVDASQVVATVGSQQALDVVGRALDGRCVATEDPVYPHARLLFGRNVRDVLPLPLDPFRGIDLDAWERLLVERRPALVYAVTSFQNPTGYSYTTAELVRLLELSERLGFALLEDDWGSDMLSDSEYRPTLRHLGGENVLYVNSFTKKLWPALRIGFVVAPAALVPSLVAQKRLSTLGSPPLLEAAVAECLERGYYDAHLGRLQAELDRRYEQCLSALRELMPDEVRWTTPGGGPTLWLELPRRVDLAALRAALGARGVDVEDATPAFAGAAHLHGFRVSYAHAPVEPVRRALEAIAGELRRVLA